MRVLKLNIYNCYWALQYNFNKRKRKLKFIVIFYITYLEKMHI